MGASVLKGRGRCVLCPSDRARFGITARGLLCMTCDNCNAQLFARSDKSDELMQQRVKVEPAAEPAAVPAPVATTAPTVPTAPAPAKARASWGLAW